MILQVGPEVLIQFTRTRQCCAVQVPSCCLESDSLWVDVDDKVQERTQGET